MNGRPHQPEPPTTYVWSVSTVYALILALTVIAAWYVTRKQGVRARLAERFDAVLFPEV